jgi:hypothetical protein
LAAQRSFRIDGTVYAWQFGNCAVRISVRNEASKIDLNKAPEALFAALFASVGVDPAKAQSLASPIFATPIICRDFAVRKRLNIAMQVLSGVPRMRPSKQSENCNRSSA